MSRYYRPLSATRAHPLVVQLVNEANKRSMSLVDIGRASGIHQQTICRWLHHGSSPRTDLLEAALNVLGQRLVIRGRK